MKKHIYDIPYMTPVEFYKHLADDTRLRSLLLIHQEGELCVCELTAALNEIQPKVSRHLAQLKKAELLLGRRQGQWIYYRINPQLPKWMLEILNTTLTNNTAFIKGVVDKLKAMPDRPDKNCCN